MNNRERLKEIILQLKQIKYDRELSAQDIRNMVEGAGGYTSLSTIRRVFAEGSENQNFRYQDTIQPIARALIGINEESEPLDATQADALKNIALLKDSMIQNLQDENSALSARVEHLSRVEQQLAEEQRKVAYLLDQVERQNRMIDKLLGSD